ncbi:unnamed protein product [Symbiodinium sp. CCMP2592]|nr:unnamed protein product [Symbiodinium sp. CCMP2592]
MKSCPEDARSCEANFCGWSNGDNAWRSRSGSTPSSDTGPEQAAEGDWYVYVESSSNANKAGLFNKRKGSAPEPGRRNARQEFILTSGIFDTSPATRHLHFYFHMFGRHLQTGSLRMDALRSSGWTQVWSRIGEQGMQWGTALVSLPQDAAAVRFVGITGDSWRSDIGLDGIAAGLPTVEFDQLSCEFGFDTCLWQSTGASSWQLAGDADGQWLEAVQSGSQASQWILETVALFNTTKDHALVFDYQLNGSSTVALELQHQASATGGWQRLWTQSGSRGAGWHAAIVTIPSSTMSLRLVANSTDDADVVRIDRLHAADVLHDWSSISCGFESDFCAWSTSSHPWLRGTGPDEAAEGESYIYTEASDNENKAFILTSDLFDPSPEARHLRFYFHMYGEDTGSLRMETLRSSGWRQLWSRIGEQGTQWGLAQVMLPQDARAVRFIGITGSDFKSDIGLDGIATGLPTVEFDQLTCEFSLDTCLWQSTGASSWQLAGDASGQWLEASGNSSQASEFILETAALFSTTGEKGLKLSFEYQLNGSDAVALEVQHQISAGDWQRLLLESAGRGAVWHTATVAVPVGSVGFSFVANLTREADVVRIDSLRFWRDFTGVACDFEVDLCGWSTGEHPWLRNTASDWTDTGPALAAQGGWYAYVDSQADDQDFVLNSSVFEPSEAIRHLHFRFHMHGEDMGRLQLEAFRGVGWTELWSRTGEQGQQWQLAVAHLPPNVTALRFVGTIYNGGWLSDMALDAIATGLPTVEFDQLTCEFGFDTCLWQSTGASSWQLAGDADGQWLEAVQSGSQASQWILETAALFNTTEEKALVFDYELNGSGTVALELQHQASATGGWQRLWTQSGSRDAGWHAAIVTIPSSTMSLRLLANSTDDADVVRIDSLHEASFLHDWSSISCGFESDYCAWSTSSHAWLRRSGTTASLGTGPDGAAEGESYVYTEASDNENKEFILTSDLFDPSPEARHLHFYFHMYGEHTGSLQMETLRSSGWTQLWSRLGAQGTQWGLAQVMLPHDARAVRFVGTTGDSFRSDMALDGIAAGLPNVEFDHLTCDFRFDTCLWQSTGASSWQLEGDASGQWLQASGNSSQASEFILETAALFSATGEKVLSLSFEYQLNGSDAVALEVQHRISAGDWQRLLLESGGRGAAWHTSVVTVPPSTLGLRFVANASTDFDMVRLDFLSAIGSAGALADVTCTFENDTCKWLGAWQRRSGPSANPTLTGPEAAFHAESYVYTSDSEHEVAVLTSPLFAKLANVSYLEFAYHMFGSGVGKLELWYLKGGRWSSRWSRQGNQGADWLQAKVRLPSGVEMLRFVSSGATTWAEVALDAILAWEGPEAAPEFLSLSSDGFHNCAVLKAQGLLKCWGSGLHGRLGYGSEADVGTAPGEMGENLPAVDLGEPGVRVTQVACGWWHTCAVLETGVLKCFGSGYNGKLGYGHTRHVGDEPLEMGAHLPAVDLGPGAEVVQVDAADRHTCALLRGGSVKCFGEGRLLGLGDKRGPQKVRSCCQCHVKALERVRTWKLREDRGDEPGEMGSNLPAIDLGTDFEAVQLALGGHHSCALSSQGTVKCWGQGDLLGLGLAPAVVDLGPLPAVQIAAGDRHTCAVLSDGSAKCWGANHWGQLGHGSREYAGDEPGEMGTNLSVTDLGDGMTVVRITVGAYHTCAILQDRTLKCWGSGESGQLGQGNTEDLGDEPSEMGSNLRAVGLGNLEVRDVSVGESHTCVLLEDDTTRCWGTGNAGQLGIGSTLNVGQVPGELGVALVPALLFPLTLGAGFQGLSFAEDHGPARGLLQMQHNGFVGLACDDGLDDRVAQVACRDLGMAGGRALTALAMWGAAGAGTILADNIRCTGAEVSLRDCEFRGWHLHDCTLQEAAGRRSES